MTIGIGVLCSSQPKPHLPRPDSIVLIADTMGSTETDSTDELYKMWINDELRVYAVGSGILEFGGELFMIVENELKEASKASVPRTHAIMSAALNKAFQIHRAQHFQWDIVQSRLAIPLIGQIADLELLRKEWQQFQLNIHMLFASFDDTGQAYLYTVGQFYDATGNLNPKTVYLSEFPGYAVIGSGGDNANSWLNYRRQSLGRSIKQSIYHAYEAKRMAARAPTVNDAVEIAIIPAGGKSFHLSERDPVIDGCPVSLPELESWFEKYGPQSSDALGHPKSKPSAARKSARVP